jgi:hypothetical protein
MNYEYVWIVCQRHKEAIESLKKFRTGIFRSIAVERGWAVDSALQDWTVFGKVNFFDFFDILDNGQGYAI